MQDEPGRHYGACLSLLHQGPFFATETFMRAMGDATTPRQRTPAVVAVVRAELLAFLRSVIQTQGTSTWASGITTQHPFTFSATGPYVGGAVEGDVRDVIVLQLMSLLMQVGLSQIRICTAPDCDRLYVKVFRREFCSVRCQSRTYMKTKRANERRKRERAAIRRRRTR